MDDKEMKKLISLLMAACLVAPWAQAQTAPAAAKKSAKKHTTKAKASKAVQSKAGKLLDDDDKEFDAGTSAVTNVTCELGNKLTLYRNGSDSEHMALRWNQRVHQMTRVSTSTGADRFENSKFGLVWIGIPAKGMLLDAKRGQQLANECKDAEQMRPAVAAPIDPAPPAELAPPIAAPGAAPKAEPTTVLKSPLKSGPTVEPNTGVRPAPAPAAEPAAGPKT